MCLIGEQQAHPGADSAWMVLISISVSDLTLQSQRFPRLYAITLGGRYEEIANRTGNSFKGD